MASAARKTYKSLWQQLQKEYKSGVVSLPDDREILVQLIYAALLENNSAAAAMQAFERIEDSFIDWNELRVSTTAELLELLPMLRDSRRNCERVRQTLQWIFQATYNFDLEDWRDKGYDAFHKYLTGNPFLTRFIIDYTERVVFHADTLPLDEGAMRVLRMLDLVDVSPENQEEPKSWELGVPKASFNEFVLLLHELGAAFMADPASSKIRKFLKAVDPESTGRSYIPLVDIQDRDPLEIARELANKQRKSFKMSFVDELDDSGDEEDGFGDETESLEEPVAYSEGEYGENDESGFSETKSAPSPKRKDAAKAKEPKKAKEDKPVKEPKEPVPVKETVKEAKVSSKKTAESKEPKPAKAPKELGEPKAVKGSKESKKAKEPAKAGAKTAKSAKGQKMLFDMEPPKKAKKQEKGSFKAKKSVKQTVPAPVKTGKAPKHEKQKLAKSSEKKTVSSAKKAAEPKRVKPSSAKETGSKQARSASRKTVKPVPAKVVPVRTAKGKSPAKPASAKRVSKPLPAKKPAVKSAPQKGRLSSKAPSAKSRKK